VLIRRQADWTAVIILCSSSVVLVVELKHGGTSTEPHPINTSVSWRLITTWSETETRILVDKQIKCFPVNVLRAVATSYEQ